MLPHVQDGHLGAVGWALLLEPAVLALVVLGGEPIPNPHVGSRVGVVVVVVDEHRLAAAVAADLQLAVAELSVLRVVGEEVQVDLGSGLDVVRVDHLPDLAASQDLGTHGCSVVSGKRGGILPFP